MGAAPLERQVAKLVDDQQLRLGVKNQPLAQLAIGFALRERGEERGGAGEEYRMTGFDDGATERDREMRFADAGRAEDQDVFRLREESAGRELADQALIHRRLECEI